MPEPTTAIRSVRPDGKSRARGRSGPAARLGRRAASIVGRTLSSGTILVEDETGDLRLGRAEPRVRVRVHDPRAYGSVLRRGSIGLGQSYVDGWWDCDDLTEFVRVLVRNRRVIGDAQDRFGRVTSILTDPFRRLWRRSPTADRRDVRAHYDIGNQFFCRMLDPTMSYSCALFERPDMTLEEASIAKLNRICRKLALSPTDHVVEIGTGWGGFAIHAATHFGCRVTSTTISAEQYTYASKEVADLGLSDRVTILQQDYRDLRGQYDKLVSIEMIEAVDWPLLDTFFKRCARLLRADGLMALQAITIADRSYDRAKNDRDFIKAFIFPGGCLPSVKAIAASVAKTDMLLVDLEDIGPHYAETLRRWRGNVDERRSEIEDLGFDERFLRLWRLYLSYCEAAFIERHVSDVQIVMAKPGWRPPLLLRS
ncbi:MAG TPA: cyclopropane-fatty-acyl-phospholipid synthase family protein [Acidimicrobiales bacterium]|nr:cyclopropane-fatty-acyl-phospholipid synthase family protein [Acidimicrobiales bacterium]